MKTLLIIAVGLFGLFGLPHLFGAIFGKIQERDEKKGGACSLYIVLLGILFMLFLNILGLSKSCSSSHDRGPKYDYYEDRAR